MSKVRIALLSALTCVSAFAQAASSVSHRIYDGSGATFADDPSVQNMALASGSATYTTNGASFGGNFGGATAYTQVDTGVGYLKSYSKVTAAEGRDGAQSLASLSFTDTLTFAGGQAGLVKIGAHLDGSFDGAGSAPWFASGAGNSANLVSHEGFTLGANVSEQACGAAFRVYGLGASFPGGGQVTIYIGCQARAYFTPTGNFQSGQVIDDHQNYSLTLELEFTAAAGQSIEYFANYSVRNRLQPFMDENGLYDANRGPAEIVADFSHTMTIDKIQAAPGMQVSSLAGPLAFGADGNLTYQAVLDQVAPVPEPGEWAMMAAGLGIVGAVARKRRRRA